AIHLPPELCALLESASDTHPAPSALQTAPHVVHTPVPALRALHPPAHTADSTPPHQIFHPALRSTSPTQRIAPAPPLHAAQHFLLRLPAPPGRHPPPSPSPAAIHAPGQWQSHPTRSPRRRSAPRRRVPASRAPPPPHVRSPAEESAHPASPAASGHRIPSRPRCTARAHSSSAAS